MSLINLFSAICMIVILVGSMLSGDMLSAWGSMIVFYLILVHEKLGI